MADDAWRAKWGNLTREQVERYVAESQATRDAQERCDHHWHTGSHTISTLMAGPNQHRARVSCCRCGALAWKAWRDEPYTPEGCGRHANTYRDGPATYEIEYITVPTIDP